MGPCPRPLAPEPRRCGMNPAESITEVYQREPSSHESGPSPDDPRVVQALRQYLAAIEAGRKPDRNEFQSRFPEIAETLAECLDGLEFIQTAAPHLNDLAQGPTMPLPFL